LPGVQTSRSQAVTRLGIESELKAVQEVQLAKDDTFMTDRVMNGSKHLVIDFLGNVCHLAWGEDFQLVIKKILQKGSFSELCKNHRFEVASKSTNKPPMTVIRQRMTMTIQ
jgi:hypothetical protein